MAAGQKTNTILVPEAKKNLDQFKWETAQQVGLNLQPGDYGGDVPSRMWGAVGGHMVRQMIETYQQGLAGNQAQAQATTQPQPSQYQGNQQ